MKIAQKYGIFMAKLEKEWLANVWNFIEERNFVEEWNFDEERNSIDKRLKFYQQIH